MREAPRRGGWSSSAATRGACLDTLGTVPCCPPEPFNRAEIWGGHGQASDGASLDVQLSHYQLTSEARHQEQCCLCISTSSPRFPAQHTVNPFPRDSILILFLVSVDRLNSKWMEELQHLEGYTILSQFRCLTIPSPFCCCALTSF